METACSWLARRDASVCGTSIRGWPPKEAAGKGPRDGVIFDHNLKSADVTWAKLENFDPYGKFVRSFSSEGKPEVTLEQLGRELNVPLYCIRPLQIFLAAAGIHRFVWNMRIPALQSLFHEFRKSAQRTALPARVGRAALNVCGETSNG